MKTISFKQTFLVVLFASLSLQGAIFGSDDRQYVKLPSSAQAASVNQKLARSTAIAVLSSNREEVSKGMYKLLTDESPFCSSERFAKDRILSFSCTGFLVAPDILVTAGHCVYAINNPGEQLVHETGKACEVFSWLFDYQINHLGQLNTENIPESRFAKCKEIIYAVQNQNAPFLDFAIIQLDRAMNRPFLKLANQEPALRETLFTIGYPFGTPAKISPRGQVKLTNPLRQSFITTLDVFEGNSGSPVFNAKNEVVGILVAGTPSNNTVEDKQNKCLRQNRCSNSGTNCLLPDADSSIFPEFQTVGSDVQRISTLKKWLSLIEP